MTVVVSGPEAQAVPTTHLSFDNASGGDRVFACQGASHILCTWATVDSGNQHATRVTSILASDLTEGQDPSHPQANGRFDRSGVARKTKIMGIDGDDRPRMVDLATARGDTYILNQSAGSASADPHCLGQDARARDFNTLYESGIASFISAGNTGWSGTARSGARAMRWA